MPVNDPLSRRAFLGTTLATSLAAVRARLTKIAALAPVAAAAQEPAAPLPGLDAAGQAALRAAIDEIVPQSDGMPAASAAGVLDYVGARMRVDASLGDLLSRTLERLEAVSRARAGGAFAEIAAEPRVEALVQLQAESPELFEPLRILVYEAYYTRPEVFALIGYEPHPTNTAGPMMAAFDPESLARVRSLPALYREAD